MPDTGAPWNLTYPDSSGSVDTWLHWQALAEDVDAALDLIDAALDDVVADVAQAIDYANNDWIDYSGTFTLTASTTPPTKGNSTYSAQYLKIHPKLWFVQNKLTLGSTFAPGSGTYRFSTPAAASVLSIANMGGTLYVNDSGTALRSGVVSPNGAAGYVTAMYQTSAAGVAVDLTSAGTGTAWANLDGILLNYWMIPA